MYKSSMAQQGVHSRTKPQDKAAILMSWCAANEIVIHPDLEIVLNPKPSSARTTRATRQTTLTAPLVDYSDDDIDDADGAMSLELDHDDERRKGYGSANDPTIPGMAVISRSFIECNTTVVQIPPRAVLSYPNVFGITLTDQARHQIPQWQLGAADPITIKSSSQQRREVQCPPGAAYERSGVYVAPPTVPDWLSLVNTNPADIEGSGADAALALSLALLNELTKEEASRWSGYLQSLPVEEPSLAIFWDDSDMLDVLGVSGADGEHARSDLHRQLKRRITGTQLERYLKSPAIQKQMIAIRTFFTRVVEPFLSAQEQTKRRENSQKEMSGRNIPSRWAMFRRAYALISSRAFWVDAYHGLALVPVADAFNHTEEHHVHLETDWEVCRICGALNSCPHDGDEPDLEHNAEQDGEFEPTSSMNPIQHLFDMVCDRTIDGGSEVFNTYNVEPRPQSVGVSISNGISNVELMCRYGFVLEGNGADRLMFDEEEVRHASANHFPAGSETPFEDVNEEGRIVDRISEIGALFVDAGLLLLENSDTDGLEMDAEGIISMGLWTRLAQQALFHARANGDDDGDSQNGAVANSLVQGVCACVVGLCEGRLKVMGEDENSDDEDEERQGEGLLTVVGRYVRGERALLKAAVQLWMTFGDSDIVW